MLHILYARYNEDDYPYDDYIGFTKNDNMIDVMRVMQEALMPIKTLSCDFNDDYRPIDIEDYNVYELQNGQDFYRLCPSNVREEYSDSSLYKIHFSLWSNGDNYDSKFKKVVLYKSQSRDEVKAHAETLIKSINKYKELMEEHGEVEIVPYIEEFELEDLDKRFEKLIKIL